MDGDLLSVVLCATQHERHTSSYYFPPATWQPTPSTSAASTSFFLSRVPVEPPPPLPVEAALPSLFKQEYLPFAAYNININTNIKRKGELAKIRPVSKRRKSEQKRIVRVQSDEQAPSDEWAWRKYGQKPIKGSPYPRSYYKCSSCKGCPARKQVERCPTDPALLILAYTFHHNHPAPKRITNSHFIAARTTTAATNSCSATSTLKEPTTTTTTTTTTTATDEPNLLVEDTQQEKSSSSTGINDFCEDVFGFLEDLDVDLLGATWEEYNEDEDENENEELKRMRGPCYSSLLDNLFPWSSSCSPLASSSTSFSD